MTTDIAIRTSETPLAAYQAYADNTLATAIAGDLLKFTKGEWLRGEAKDLVPADAMFIANMHELWQGWTKWQDSAPVEHRIHRVAERITISRNQLGDLDESQWERDTNGAPRDPWSMTDRLVMKDDCTKDLVTFTTSSHGGRHGLAKLCRAYAKDAAEHGGKFPVVQLAVDKSWRHNEYGIIPRPQFNIIGWAFWDDEAENAAAETVTNGDQNKHDILDDSVPF